MDEAKKGGKKVKTFIYKWREFLIINGILNIYIFWGINTIINGINEDFSKLYTGVMIDGADFSLFSYMFATPIFISLTIINIGFFWLLEFLLILIFKLFYFVSETITEDKIELNKFIKKSLLYFALANIVGELFWVDINRIFLFIFIYLPMPLFCFLLFCTKLKKEIKKKNMETV